MANTASIETVHNHAVHTATAFPGGHSNTALCGAPLIGRIRWVQRPSNCPQCRAA